MGGMGRPEPLSAHRPRRQQRLSGFHETRNTKHESRLFFESRPFCRVDRQLMREGGKPAGFKGRCTKRGVNEWKGVFSESRDRNNDLYRIRIRFKIRYSPLFVGIRRKDSDKPLPPIKRPRALRQSGHRLHGCVKSPPDLPRPAGRAKWRGEGRTGHESRNTAFDQARGASRPGFRGLHETRATNHGFFSESRPLWPFGSPWVREGWRHRKPPSGPLPPPPSHCFPVHHCSPLFTIVRHCSPLFTKKILSCASALVPPGRCFPARCGAAWGGYGAAWAAWGAPSHCSRTVRAGNNDHSGFHETRDTSHETRLFPGARRKPARVPRFSRNTKHETRITAFSAFPTNSHEFPPPPPPPDVRVPVSISVGFAASAVRCRCCRPLGCFHRRERNRNPCSESRTFWLALTSRSAGAD